MGNIQKFRINILGVEENEMSVGETVTDGKLKYTLCRGGRKKGFPDGELYFYVESTDGKFVGNSPYNF